MVVNCNRTIIDFLSNFPSSTNGTHCIYCDHMLFTRLLYGIIDYCWKYYFSVVLCAIIHLMSFTAELSDIKQKLEQINILRSGE